MQVSPVSIVSLGGDDVEQAIELSTEVGWNQNAADWHRLISLNPQNCLGIRKDGRLAATATLASYGSSLGWVGMVIVSPPYRGQGLARALLEEVIRQADGEGISTLGLDATDLGRPVYQRLGFHDLTPIDRWSGVLSVDNEHASSTENADLEVIMAWDRAASGADRSALLKHLAGEPEVAVLATDIGYAFLRPGRQFWHLGPAVAGTKSDFCGLLSQAARRLTGRPVLIDAVRSVDVFSALTKAGLTVQRSLTRMVRRGEAPSLADGPWQLAMGFEWG